MGKGVQIRQKVVSHYTLCLSAVNILDACWPKYHAERLDRLSEIEVYRVLIISTTPRRITIPIGHTMNRQIVNNRIRIMVDAIKCAFFKR